jgi:hypothetical protein
LGYAITTRCYELDERDHHLYRLEGEAMELEKGMEEMGS